MNVLDDYMVDIRLSLLDKTRIQAQVLVPVLRALRAELGQERADAIVKDALRDWSKQLFAAVGESVDGSSRRKWAAMHTALAEVTEREVTVDMRRHDEEALESVHVRPHGSPCHKIACLFCDSYGQFISYNLTTDRTRLYSQCCQGEE